MHSVCVCFTYHDYHYLAGGMIFSQLGIERQLNLQEISQDRFKLHTIESSCRLRDAAAVKDAGNFKRGYAYYEFFHEKENISEGKEIILMREVVFLNFIAQDTVSFYYL